MCGRSLRLNGTKLGEKMPEQDSGCRIYIHTYHLCRQKSLKRVVDPFLRVMCSGLLPGNIDGGFSAWILQLLRFVLVFNNRLMHIFEGRGFQVLFASPRMGMSNLYVALSRKKSTQESTNY